MTEPSDPFAPLAPFYDELMSLIPYGQWVDYTLRLFSAAGGEGSRGVDLATGTGSVALELARRGFQMTGIDRSLPMLREAVRKRTPDDGRVVWACQDLRHLGLAPCFDLAVCLYDSLNYLASPRDFTIALRQIAQVLRPGGVLIFDLNSIHALEAELFTQEDLNPSTPVRHRWTSRYNPMTRVSVIEMRFWLPDGREVAVTHRQRGYEIAEVLAAIKTAGLDCAGIYDGAGLVPPTGQTERIYFAARRP